jgi:hypothetical protein
MIARMLLATIALAIGSASTTAAQQREPLPVAVVDIRGASVGLPTAFGWTPPVPENAVVPSRSLGLDAGGNVYFLRRRAVSLGIGGGVIFARGVSTPVNVPDAEDVLPEVTTRLAMLASQFSVNFGHRAGWSYISGGLGRSRVRSEASPIPPATVPSNVEVGWVQTINYGGGARWFFSEHFAFSLDLRWYRLPELDATTTRPATGRATLLVASGGISIK